MDPNSGDASLGEFWSPDQPQDWFRVLGVGKFPRHFDIVYLKANDERIRLAGNDASLHPFFWRKPAVTIWSVWAWGTGM